jgi:hypothetical protein
MKRDRVEYGCNMVKAFHLRALCRGSACVGCSAACDPERLREVCPMRSGCVGMRPVSRRLAEVAELPIQLTCRRLRRASRRYSGSTTMVVSDLQWVSQVGWLHGLDFVRPGDPKPWAMQTQGLRSLARHGIPIRRSRTFAIGSSNDREQRG